MALQPEFDSLVVACQSGDGMSKNIHIPWFNPREMNDATVLHLNTGRDALLHRLFAAVHERLAHTGVFTHWLLTGTRGAGKSFFLRLVQASFPLRLEAQFAGQARFVLLPEEHRNIYSAHELLAEIERMLRVGDGDLGASPVWRVKNPEAAWADALASLLKAFPERLLVVGVENFDELLAQAFSDETDNARLRHLMSNQPRLMFVATAVQGAFDENYEQRLFRQFEHHPIPPWDATDHRDYLTRRADRVGKSITPLQLARIDAYSYYTGGNARAAAVLAGAILEDTDPLQVAGDLDAAIEKMSDYYRALIDRIPPQTRKLFDALIRGGDPASQSEIAQRTGAQQNEISRAFAWLVDQGYVSESRLAKAKTKQYRVQDRLLVQFYRMRSISPGQRSKLALMADLLADILLFNDKWTFAHRYATQGHNQEARTLIEWALKERMIDATQLPEALQATEKLCAMGDNWAVWDSIAKVSGGIDRDMEILRQYPTDEAMRNAIDTLVPLAEAKSYGEVSGKTWVAEFMGMLLLNPVQKLGFLASALSENSTLGNALKLSKEVRSAETIAKKKLSENVIFHFKRDFELGRIYPRTVSLIHMSIRVISESGDLFGKIDDAVAANWAAEAALNWINAKESKRAESALSDCITILGKLSTEGRDDAVLAICKQLDSDLQRFSPVQRGIIKLFKGIAQTSLDQYANAYHVNEQAHQDFLKTSHTALTDAALSMMAINLGQMARQTALHEGAEAAWTVLDAHLNKVGEQFEVAIAQLGDAVAEASKHQGEAAGFALGVALLQGLAQRTAWVSESVLRRMWIKMIEADVPLGLLRDLLDEWPHLFDHQAHPSLHDLRRLLHDWLTDIATPPEQRAARRLTLDPDLATTLTALGEHLTPATQQRLGYTAAQS